jgi:hypothetical protein
LSGTCLAGCRSLGGSSTQHYTLLVWGQVRLVWAQCNSTTSRGPTQERENQSIAWPAIRPSLCLIDQMVLHAGAELYSFNIILLVLAKFRQSFPRGQVGSESRRFLNTPMAQWDFSARNHHLGITKPTWIILGNHRSKPRESKLLAGAKLQQQCPTLQSVIARTIIHYRNLRRTIVRSRRNSNQNTLFPKHSFDGIPLDGLPSDSCALEPSMP